MCSLRGGQASVADEAVGMQVVVGGQVGRMRA